jgi:hypothetical protein
VLLRELRGSPEDMNLRVFPNLRRMHEYWNQLSFLSPPFSPIHEKEIFPWELGNI